MQQKSESRKKQISFLVSPELALRMKRIPWGVRNTLLIKLIEAVLGAAEKRGTMIYGAIVDGNFTLEYKEDA